MTKKLVRLFLVMSVIGVLTSCSATHSFIEKQRLDVDTHTSSTLYLPLKKRHQSIYLQVIHPDKAHREMVAGTLTQTFRQNGVAVVAVIKQADFLVQVRVLEMGHLMATGAQEALHGGYGERLPPSLQITEPAIKVSEPTRWTHMKFLPTMDKLTSRFKDDGQVLGAIIDIQVSERHTVEPRWRRFQTRMVSTAKKARMDEQLGKQALSVAVSQEIVKLFMS